MRRRCSAMTHASQAVTHPIADDDELAIGGAWLGPAIGAAILTLAWAAYLVPVFLGIVMTAPR